MNDVGRSMQDRATRCVLCLLITMIAWGLTLVMATAYAFSILELKGDPVAGQIISATVVVWIVRTGEGAFLGAQFYCWLIVGALYLIAFVATRSRRSLAGILSLCYAIALFIFPLSIKYLGPACFGVLQVIKSNPSEYVLTLPDFLILLATIVICAPSMVLFVPIVSLTYAISYVLQKPSRSACPATP